MSLKLLQSIEQAEAKAEDIRAQAQREAREMLKSVEEACIASERQAALEHRALAQSVLEEAKAAAERNIQATSHTEAQTREEITRQAQSKLDAAAAIIFERVVQNGHS